MEFSKTVNRFGDEIFAALNEKKIELEKRGVKTYNLSVGTPDFKTPQHIIDALNTAAADPDNWKYTLRDSDRLTNAVISYYEKRFGVKLSPDEIQSCNGTQDGLGHIGLVLANEGDTVLLPTPCYPLFITSAKLCGAEPYYYPMTAENHFLPNVKDIPDDVADRAKFMVVSLPSNPMGSVGTPEVYEEIIAFAKKHDIIIIHDNAYSDIIFDGKKGTSFLNYPGAKDVGVEFFSLSKSFNMTGARVSFLVGRSDIVAAFRKIHQQTDFGMFMPVQEAAVAALTGPLDSVKKQCMLYQERRDALCGGLRSIGWDAIDSEGTMFVWVPLPKNYTDSTKFALDLMEKSGVIVTPGINFGPLGEGYVRFALVLPPEKIQEAVTAIQKSGIIG